MKVPLSAKQKILLSLWPFTFLVLSMTSREDSFADPGFQVFFGRYIQERLNRRLPNETTLGLVDLAGNIVNASTEALCFRVPNLPHVPSFSERTKQRSLP